MPGISSPSSDHSDPALPPRPTPPRSPGEAASAWLAWFGVGRLAVAGVSLVIVAAGGYWLLRAPAPDTVALLPAADAGLPATSTLPPPTAAPTSAAAPGPIVVHVAGAVPEPGVFTLPAGARVHAAVDAAGGPNGDAELDGLNLAAPLADGQRVYVPVVGEVDPAAVAEPLAEPTAQAGTAAAGPINLNAATATELERLPGVGPATAAAIVDDRVRSGPFAAVDDLDRVPGIGPAKLEALRPMVTV